MEIIFIITGAMIILIGIAIRHLKLYNWIAGYNTMSPGDRANFNIERFASMMRNVFLIMGLFIILGAVISIHFKNEIPGLLFFFISIVSGLSYLVIRGQKLKRESKTKFRNESGH